MRCLDPVERRRSARGALALLVVCGLLAQARTAPAQGHNAREDESAAFVAEGRDALRRGAFGDAERSFEQALQLDPNRIEAYLLRAAMYARRGKFASGVAVLRRARQRAPQDLEVQAALGAQLVRSGAAEEGVPLLEQVLRGDRPHDGNRTYDAYLALGQYWQRAGEPRRAIVALRTYLRIRPEALQPEDSAHHVELANALLRAGLPRQAWAQLGLAPATDPRVQLAQAWTLAALDCAKAWPLLLELRRGGRYPEVLLVMGQCALERGDLSGAMSLVRSYLEGRSARSAQGHGLLAEIYAARGDLMSARRELEVNLAEQAQPPRAGASPAAVERSKLWSIRMAALSRRAGAFDDAIVQLKQARPRSGWDPEAPLWWLEMGKAVLGKGDRAELASVRAQLEPMLTALEPAPPSDDELFGGPPPAQAPRFADERLWTVLGELQLALDEPAPALQSLERALAMRFHLRTRALRDRAIERLATARLQAGDAAAAEPLLAALVDGRGAAMRLSDAALWRNLGIARLELRRWPEAAAAFERSLTASRNAMTAMLLARALAGAGDQAEARKRYILAASIAVGADRIKVAIDRASFELDVDNSLTALEVLASVNQEPGREGKPYQDALTAALHAAGLTYLRAGNSTKALELLQEAATRAGDSSLRCDYAVAAVAARGREAAKALAKLGAEQCPMMTQTEGLALPILSAVVDGESPGRARAALDALAAMSPHNATSRALVAAATRVVALNAAGELYRGERASANAGRVRDLLAAAVAAKTSFADDELAHNIAVIDLATGRTETARTTLERLTARFPEALINLGVAYDQLGKSDLALKSWLTALGRGARFAPLVGWIAAKRLLLEDEP